MRLWSLHPRFLDPRGLVALWREALLARAVLAGQTRGYRAHPQLQRFSAQAAPLDSLDVYLAAVHAEAGARGYRFDPGKFEAAARAPAIAVTRGQLDCEWQHLLRKLEQRSPALHAHWRDATPSPHPLFALVDGPRAPWEKAEA